MKTKVCGMTSIDGLQALASMNVDYAGLIFYPGSKRYALPALQNSAGDVRGIHIEKVGVFVNEELPVVLQRIEEYGLSAVQLHGDEPPAYCSSLSKVVTVIKAFRITGDEDIDRLVEPFSDSCDYFLFDTHVEASSADGKTKYGGTGHRFNWSGLLKAHIGKPFFLSGGIGPGDAEAVRAFNHPYFYAVDLNSRFEVAPGVKDMERVGAFFKEIG